MLWALRKNERLAARASSDATGACPVSSNVAAHHCKTVISRANLPALFYFRAFDCQPSRARRREKKRQRCDEPFHLLAHHISLLSFAPRRARRVWAGCQEIKQSS
jgi:hypothetical protein